MNINHLSAIVRKEFHHIMRDRGVLFLLTAGPVFLMVIFVYAMTADVRNVPVAIVDLADNAASKTLIERLDETEAAAVTMHLASVEAIDARLDRNEVRAALVIPEGYGNMLGLMTGNIPQMKIIIDGTEPMSAERVMEAVYTEVEDHMREMAQNAFGDVPGFDSALLARPVEIEMEQRYNPDLRPIIDFYPGLASMVLSLPGIALAMALAREHELGTMEQLVATPVNKLAMLLGKAVPYLVFGLLDVLLILALGRFFYSVPFRGNLILFLVLSFFFLFSNTGIGLLISVLIRSQQLAMVVAFLIFFLPGFFLSGVFFPIWAMPWVLQIELQMLPVTHYVTISKALYLQDVPAAGLLFNAAALVGLGVGFVALSVVLFRKKVA